MSRARAQVREWVTAPARAAAAAKDLPPGWLVYELAQSHFRIIAPGGETYKSLGAARAAIMADGR